MSFKDDYNELKECFASFKRNHYFEKFTSGDIFCVNEQNKMNLILMTFIDQFFGESMGLQLFYTKDGINYVHDILSSGDDGVINIGDCDSIVAVYKKQKELTKDDYDFLKKLDQKVVREYNLICYRFTKGLKPRVCNKNEISIVSLYGVFLASLIPNEHKYIVEAFNRGDSVMAKLNVEEKRYDCFYGPLPYLEIKLRKEPVNEPFVKEYSNHPYLNEDCHLCTSYLPVIIKENGVRPLLLYFYFVESNRFELKYIIDSPKEYKNCIYGILDDIFTSIGQPAKMIINSRELYYILTKTLDALNIENVFQRELDFSNKDDVSILISRMYEKTLDTEMESKEAVSMLLDLISNVVKNENEYDIEENKETGVLVS